MLKGLFRIFLGYPVLVLLLLLISLTTVSYTLVDLTSRDIVGSVMSSLLFSQSHANEFAQLEKQLTSQCRGKSRIELPFTENEFMEIDCNKGNEAGFKQAFIDAFVGKVYYQEYDCILADCPQKYFSQDTQNPEGSLETAFFLLSSKMNSILKAIFVVLFTVTLLVALLASLLIGTRKIGGIFVSLGIISAAFSFFKQSLIAIASNAPSDFANIIIERVSKISLFSSLVFLPIGIFLLVFNRFGIKKQGTGKKSAKKGKK